MELDERMLVMEELACVGMCIYGHVMMIFDVAHIKDVVTSDHTYIHVI